MVAYPRYTPMCVYTGKGTPRLPTRVPWVEELGAARGGL